MLRIFNILALSCVVLISYGFVILSPMRTIQKTILNEVKKDDKGYLIKERDWFNGLSMDPGDSINDPRSVPLEAKEFAVAVKNGAEVKFDETIRLIDKHYTYFAVPFTNGTFSSDLFLLLIV